jgi:hypothetical protein
MRRQEESSGIARFGMINSWGPRVVYKPGCCLRFGKGHWDQQQHAWDGTDSTEWPMVVHKTYMKPRFINHRECCLTEEKCIITWLFWSNHRNLMRLITEIDPRDLNILVMYCGDRDISVWYLSLNLTKTFKASRWLALMAGAMHYKFEFDGPVTSSDVLGQGDNNADPLP